MTKSINNINLNALQYAETEAERYKRLGQRYRDLKLIILAQAYESIAAQLKNAAQLQAKMLLHPERMLTFGQQADKEQIVK